MSKDYYKTLGVSKEASQDEIKKAFRKLAHQHHPDKQNGDAEKFKEINEAYQVLGDENKRKQYDQFGSGFNQAGGFGGQGFNWQDFARQYSAQGGAQGANFDFGDFDLGDIFGEAFGFGRGRRRRSGPQRGDDIQLQVTIDFEAAVRGMTRAVELNRTEKCPECSGNGAEPGSPINTCNECGGSGSQVRAQQTPFGTFQTKTVCRSCSGQGQTFEKPCRRCDGQGIVKAKRTLEIQIPAGIDDGETIRVTGEGEAGTKGGPAGDLYVQVRVNPSTKFAREGYDLISKIYIDYPTAVLGGRVPVETLDGEVELKIPAGTQSGTIHKLKGKGIPKLHGRGTGDHLVKVEVETPAKVSRKAKKLLEELKEEL